MALPHSPIRLAPAGQKTAWGASRQKSDSRVGRAEIAHLTLKDTPRRIQKTPSRKETQDVATRRRARTAMDARRDTAIPEGSVIRPMTRTPSQTDRVGATARGRNAGDGRRFRREESEPDVYSSPGAEGDRHGRGRDRRSAPRRDPKRMLVIRPLKDLYTRPSTPACIGWKVAARATTQVLRAELTVIGRSSRCR